MPNPYFNNFNSTPEQTLLEDLIIETTKMYGLTGYYITRTLDSYDKLLGEDTTSRYDAAYLIDYYLESITSYTGPRDIMSVIGLQSLDDLIFSVPRRTFQNDIGAFINSTRPRESDLIYFPLHKKCFQIMHVDQFQTFYQLGALYSWKLSCGLFTYSGERFETGIPEVDILQSKYSTDAMDYAVTDENNIPLMDESNNIITTDDFKLENILPNADNEEIDRETDPLIDWTIDDPFNDYKGKKI